MPKIVFTEPSGARREIDAPAGVTLMEVAWDPRTNSPLSCQVHISANLDGLEVAVPKRQRE